MKTLIGWFFAGVFAVGLHAAEPGVAAASPLAPLASWVGGVWVAAVPGPKDQAPLAIELTFTWAENRTALKFESAFVRAGKRLPYTSGFYAWNAAKKQIAIFYADAGGSLVEGLLTQEGDEFLNELQATEPTGKITPIRVKTTKVGADVFTNEIFLQQEGAWVPFVTARYERAATAAK